MPDSLPLSQFTFTLPPDAEPPEAGEGDVLDALAGLLIDLEEEAQTDDPTCIPDPDHQRRHHPHH